jgi:hypothetical protein
VQNEYRIIARMNNYQFKIMLIEPGGTLNTGNAGGQLTDTREEWI